MKILVTGANGLLGQKLTDLLRQSKDVTCIATARLSGHAQKDIFDLDITNRNQVYQVLAVTKPDVVINTAAMTNVDACEDDREGCMVSNVSAVEYLIDACIENGCRLIHVSTDFIFDGTHGPLDENEKPAPINFYGESKLMAERLLIESKVSWCILRTILVYGVSRDLSRSNIVLWARKSLMDGKSISVVNDQWRTPTLAEDLAMGCYLAAVKNAEGVYNIGGSDMLTPYEIALQTAEVFHLDASLIQPTDSTKFTQRAKRPPKTGLTITKARKDLAYQPHTFTQGLELVKQQLE